MVERGSGYVINVATTGGLNDPHPWWLAQTPPAPGLRAFSLPNLSGASLQHLRHPRPWACEATRDGACSVDRATAATSSAQLLLTSPRQRAEPAQVLRDRMAPGVAVGPGTRWVTSRGMGRPTVATPQIPGWMDLLRGTGGRKDSVHGAVHRAPPASSVPITVSVLSAVCAVHTSGGTKGRSSHARPMLFLTLSMLSPPGPS